MTGGEDGITPTLRRRISSEWRRGVSPWCTLVHSWEDSWRRLGDWMPARHLIKLALGGELAHQQSGLQKLQERFQKTLVEQETATGASGDISGGLH